MSKLQENCLKIIFLQFGIKYQDILYVQIAGKLLKNNFSAILYKISGHYMFKLQEIA
jgi:hypothetical protein